MNKKIITAIFAFSTIFYSCVNTMELEGLWIIKLVKIGEEEMTPNARWTRFNSDMTQQSGNGWYQHSVGTWKLNDETNELSIVNSNGLDDPYGPFDIRIENDLMYWSRIEDGNKVEITLEKSEKLPETFGDKLLGLWKLESTAGDGQYFKENESDQKNEYIFFRWDRRFVINSARGRINGVYNVHGHKPEVELIPYGDLNRDFWKIDFSENAISLKLLNTEDEVVRKFERISKFPE